MQHNVQAQNDQHHSQDQLQAVGDEHSTPGGLASGDGGGSSNRDGLDHGDQALDQRGEGDAQHDDQRREQHLVVAAGDLQEYAQGSQDQGAQQLVGGTEQRPDVGIADLGQQEAEGQRDDGGEVNVAEQLAPALSVLHIIGAEQLLEAHTADTGHGIQAGQGQGGNAHRHKDGSDGNGHAEHLKEAGNAAAEDLERGTGGRGAIGSGSSTGNAQGQDSQQAFQHHGAVTDLEHVFLVLNGLGGSAGGNQAVETGNSAAGHGNKQDGEHGAQLLVVETGEDGQVHGGMSDQQADNGTGDHADEHEGGHVVTGLFQQPHGQDRSEEDVDEGDVAPGSLAQNDGEVHADNEGQHDEDDADDGLFPAGEVELLLQQAEDDSEHHEHDGDHAGSAVGVGGIRQAGHTIGGDVSVEGTGDHVSKSSDNDAAEQPAEQQEQLTAGLADVLLDQQAHGLTVILDGSIQGAEVGNSAEEDAADEHPQQDGQPAESGSLDSTGNRAGTCDGRELMAENGPAIGGHVVLAILQPHSRSFGVGVNTPGFSKPAAVPGVRTYQDDSCDQNNHKRIHLYNLPHFLHIFTIACSITLNRCSWFVNGLFIFCQHVGYIADPSKTISKF